MRCHLEGLTPPLVGKSLPITVARPARIKTNKGSDDVGEVLVAIDGLRLQLTNHSKIRCAINDRPTAEAAELVHGDRLTIGKQSFKVVVEEVACTVCDTGFTMVDRAKGWSDGARHICCQCLKKGVRPANLANAASGVVAEPAAELPDAVGTGSASRISTDQDGDSDTTQAVATSAPGQVPENDRNRRQRRLSASRLAQVEAPEVKNGLFAKVGQVFSNRESREDRKRLEHLEVERQALLVQAGRLALSENNGFGIPDHLYNPLLKGVQVSLRLQDFSIPAIERWRSIRGRLSQLDAEIGACRAQLGWGTDRSLAIPPVPLASDQRARQDHTFEIMDGLATMELDGESVLDDQVALAPGTLTDAPSTSAGPASSARSSSGRRNLRRRH